MPADCHRCGSAGCVEFGMCQVCYQEYSSRGQSFDLRSAEKGAFIPYTEKGSASVLVSYGPALSYRT